nr:hypothetical protein [Tanacetum cinerariifolium]
MEAYEPEAPLSLVYALEYPEYLAPSDDEITPTEDQPLPPSPISLSPGYITDSEPIKDGLDEDPEMDPVDYVGNKEEEEEHLALADSALFVPDSVPSVEETKPFKTDESTATPPPLRSPQTVIPLPRTGLRMARKMRARITTPSQRFEIGESSAAAAARQPGRDSKEFYTRHQEAQDDKALLRTCISTLASESVADALAAYEANRGKGNGHDSHDSGSGKRRLMPTARMCTYKDFLNCQPLNFKGTEGVTGLT